MEALAAGATVLPFVIVCIQGIKKARGLLSEYKDGGEQVKRVQQNIDNLSLILDNLYKSHGITENHDPVLEKTIINCAGDIEAFNNKHKGLTAVDTDSLVEKQRKKIKIFFKAEEMEKMSTTLSRHTDAINLHLNTMQSKMLFEVRDQVGAIDRHGKSTQQFTEERFAAVVDHQTTTTAAVRETVTADGHRTREQMTTEFQANKEALLSGLASKDQVDQMMGMFKEFLDHVGGLSNARAGKDDHRIEEVQETAQPTEDTPAEDILPYAEVEAGINSILVAAHKKQGVFLLDTAADIGEALVALLHAMQSGDFLASSVTYASAYSRWCETSTKEDILQLRRSLKAAEGVALSSHRVSVNVNGKRRRQEDVVVESRWAHQSYDIPSGYLSIMSLERSLTRRCSDSQACDAPPSSDTATELETRLKYLPKPGSSGFEVVMRQSFYAQGSFNAIPTLMVNNILPRGSRVFNLVKQGRLSEFKEMLRSRTASLRDQDERGASLLQYASRQPEMCRFLIEHGADVNHVGMAIRPLDLEEQVTAMGSGFDDGDDLESRLECHKLLLQAGCDPTIPLISSLGEDFAGVVIGILNVGRVDFIRVLLDNTPFLSVNSKLDRGRTPLIEHCTSGRYSVESISLLLSRGSDIHARADNGETCLHACFYSLIFYSTDKMHRQRAALLYLLAQGANPRAVDKYGRSVSDRAYDLFYSSYAGDLWDSVLAEAGYDVAEFRQTKRRAIYYEDYSRDIFEELWRGREHLCPYYYDDLLPFYNESGEEEEVSLSWHMWASKEDKESTDSEFGDSDSEEGGVRLL